MTAVAFACPLCGWTSSHPEDAAEGYCGRCHAFTRDCTLKGLADSPCEGDPVAAFGAVAACAPHARLIRGGRG